MIGESIKRKEDARFLTGRGRYVDDLRLPDALHLAVPRGVHAHARILAIDATRSARDRRRRRRVHARRPARASRGAAEPWPTRSPTRSPTLERQHRSWATPLGRLLAREPRAVAAADDGDNLGGSMTYTAGTTGKTKGALRRGLDAGAVVPRLEALDLAREHVHLAAGPLYHSAPGAFAAHALIFGGRPLPARA